MSTLLPEKTDVHEITLTFGNTFRLNKKFTPEEVLNLVNTSEVFNSVNVPTIYGDTQFLFKTTSDRYQVFRNSLICTNCGLEGKYFYLEKDSHQSVILWHFNLYTINENGKEMMMTKDHIIPKSKGGKNYIDNYQTMCFECNRAKGNK